MTDSANTRSIYALLLIITIDSMGYGFIFPVLTPMFLHSHNMLVPIGAGLPLQWIIFGIIVALYPLFMLFGAPILGDLSDRIGRKKVLSICLVGTFIGYIIAGIGMSYGILTLLLIGRIIDGATAGSLPMAQAAIADISSDSKQQTKYMGLMMIAIAGGQVIGPMVAGIFSDQSFSSHFNNATPFYVCALLTALNMVWLLFSFDETYFPKNDRIFSVTKSLRSFSHVFENRPLTMAAFIFLFMQFSWSLFSQAGPAYLGENYQYGNFLLGIFSASLGVLIAIGGSIVTPRLTRYVTTKGGAITGLILMAVSTAILCIWQNQIIFWICTVFNTIGAAVAFSFIIVLFSQTVDKTKQGWVMGLSGAIIAIAWTITALLAGIFINFGSIIPLIITSLFGFAAVALVLCYRQQPSPSA